MDADLDLPAYLQHIGYRGDKTPTLAVLQALHQHHAATIPFENLDVLMDRPISLALADLQAKLVRGGRGGYCFEHNMLFAAVLEALGFELTRLAARVRYRGPELRPRTHMLLQVKISGDAWIADVGFGGEGLLLPVALRDGQETQQHAWTYRVLAETDTEWLLQSQTAEGWRDLYSFSLAPQLPVDFEPANFFVSKHPESRFRHTLTAQLPTPEARYVFRDRELLIERAPGVGVSRVLKTEGEIIQMLREIFGIAVPEGFRVPELVG